MIPSVGFSARYAATPLTGVRVFKAIFSFITLALTLLMPKTSTNRPFSRHDRYHQKINRLTHLFTPHAFAFTHRHRHFVHAVLTALLISPSVQAKLTPRIDTFTFELQTTEHSYLVEQTTDWLLRQPDIYQHEDLKILLKHPEFLAVRKHMHDWEKITQHPRFVATLPPELQTHSISFFLACGYGISLYDDQSWPRDFTQEDANAIRYAITIQDQIGKRFANEALDNYLNSHPHIERNDVNIREKLNSASHRLEHIADLINRQMHETILRERYRKSHGSLEGFVYEFGYPFSVTNMTSRFWNGHPEDSALVTRYAVDKHLLMAVYKSLERPEEIIRLYRQRTDLNPFLNEKEKHRQELAIENYRSLIKTEQYAQRFTPFENATSYISVVRTCQDLVFH